MVFTRVERPGVVAIVVVKVDDDLFLGGELQELLSDVDLTEHVQFQCILYGNEPLSRLRF